MTYFEKKFNIDDIENAESVTMEQFKDQFGKQFEEQINMLEELEQEQEKDEKQIEVDGIRCGDYFCRYAGRQAVRSAIQFEDVLKWWLIRLLWCSPMGPQQFIDLLAQLCCVEQALVTKLEIGANMAGCLNVYED